MSLSNYGDLKTRIADWLARKDLDAGGVNVNRVPEFVQLGETRMNRDLARIGAGELGASTAWTTTAEAIDLPADFNGMRYLAVNGSTVDELVYLPPEVLYREYSSTAARQPRAYTIHGKDGASDVLQARFRPIPDGVYSLIAYYYKKVSTLVGGADGGTNWMLTNNPDCYLYAALVEAAAWKRDPEAASGFFASYSKALEDVKALDEARRIGGTSPRGRPAVRMIAGM